MNANNGPENIAYWALVKSLLRDLTTDGHTDYVQWITASYLSEAAYAGGVHTGVAHSNAGFPRQSNFLEKFNGRLKQIVSLLCNQLICLYHNV